jgi:hypothetical protein
LCSGGKRCNFAVFESGSRRYLPDKLGISEVDERITFNYLKHHGLVENFMQGRVIIKPPGTDILAESMEKTYADVERFVLETIFERCKQSPNGHIHYSALEDLDTAPYNESEITNELHNKNYLDSQIDECFKISVKGIEFLQGKSNSVNQTARDIYNTNNYGHSINQIGGNSNAQTAQINVNSEFDNAIKSIVDLVKSSSLSSLIKEDLITDVERIQNLAKQEPSAELVERAKSRINYLETALKVTDLALKTAPIFPHLYAFFDGLLNTK